VRLRNYFLTGIVVAAPIGITMYLTWAFVHWVDQRVKPLIPKVYNPDHYLPFSLPGVGLIFAILVLTLLGFMTASLLGRTLVSYGEMLLDQVPLVRNLYRGLRQLFRPCCRSPGGRSRRRCWWNIRARGCGVWLPGHAGQGRDRRAHGGGGSRFGVRPEHAQCHRRVHGPCTQA
jgi:uncharacterized membrane protein